MIKIRKEILDLNQTFTEHLISVQKAKHKPSYKWKKGDSVILDDSDETIVLTKEGADKLNEDELKYFLDNQDSYPLNNRNDWIGRTTLISSKKSPQKYLNDLSYSLSELSKEFGPLIILGDWNTPWLSQKNDYPLVVKATEYLHEKIHEEFNGGFLLENNEILDFIPHLFWLIRYNASLPEFMMTFKKTKTVFSMCQYGVLHLEFYDSIEQSIILKFFDNKNFKEVKECNDPIEFDNCNGRQIVVNEQ